MVIEYIFYPRKKSTLRHLQKRTWTRRTPCVFVIAVMVAMSQLYTSKALLNGRHIRPFFCSTIERPCPFSIGNHPESCCDILHAKSVLYASIKSTNKNTKRKRKHVRKKKRQKNLSPVGANERGQQMGRSISEDELHSYLHSEIKCGNRGSISRRARSRGIIEKNGDDIEDTANYISARQREQQFFLRQLNNRPTLVLNANYVPLSFMPLSLWSWQDAVKAIFKGSVTVVDVYPDLTVRASNIKVPLPSVIALNDFVPQKVSAPAFTRRNIFLRDEYKCQYCNKRFQMADLSLDHVIPRSMGGPLSWENAVTCCKKCNCKKGSTPLSELGRKGMKLNRTPRCPTQMELAAISGRMVPKRVHPTWKPYVGIQERPVTCTDASNEKRGDEEFIED